MEMLVSKYGNYIETLSNIIYGFISKLFFNLISQIHSV